MDLYCGEVIPRGISLIELEPNDCRYPYGEQEITFCGHQVQAGSSYCRQHHALCWTPSRRQLAGAA